MKKKKVIKKMNWIINISQYQLPQLLYKLKSIIDIIITKVSEQLICQLDIKLSFFNYDEVDEYPVENQKHQSTINLISQIKELTNSSRIQQSKQFKEQKGKEQDEEMILEKDGNPFDRQQIRKVKGKKKNLYKLRNNRIFKKYCTIYDQKNKVNYLWSISSFKFD
ncbi:unnamed protein product [Paramecium primaurelia]|uniref:Uncharacterized protein n=1 Tax=Paramecium primaurelia TaxID=5886 RepID=A0A8S1KTB2_PARPR|nr:unnamed protein product [Paramecium primaurelia]